MRLLREEINSEIKLSPDSEFKPFVLDNDHFSNLATLVKAFTNSDKIPLPGHSNNITTLDGNKGKEIPLKLKKKTLYLTGGAVRDFLSNKSIRDFDLVTNATPEEIRIILKHAGFTEIKPNVNNKKYNKLPEKGNKNKVFYVDAIDKKEREYIITAEINGDKFEIATFRKNPKTKNNDNVEFGSLFDDANTRDLTINSLYIPLNNPEGDNTKLIDPHGGAHHLFNGEVNFVGNPKDRINEDTSRLLRYLRFLSIYGKNKNIPDDIKELFFQHKDLSSINKDDVFEEFIKGLEHPNTNTQTYLNVYKNSGALNSIFKDLNLSDSFPDTKDKRLILAHLLQNNPIHKVSNTLKDFKCKEENEICFLLDILNWLKSPKDSEEFYNKFSNLKNNFITKTKLVPSQLRTWTKLNNLSPDDNILNKFLSFDTKIKPYTTNGFNDKKINPEIITYLNGKTPFSFELNDIIQKMENEKFKEYLNT